jgi:hypothetical protein
MFAGAYWCFQIQRLTSHFAMKKLPLKGIKRLELWSDIITDEKN